MMLQDTEEGLRLLFRALPAGAQTALIWSAVLLYYSCLLHAADVLAGRFRDRFLLRRLQPGPARIHPQERRLRRMVMNDAAAARRLMEYELSRGAPGWAAAAEWAADRLERERK